MSTNETLEVVKAGMSEIHGVITERYDAKLAEVNAALIEIAQKSPSGFSSMPGARPNVLMKAVTADLLKPLASREQKNVRVPLNASIAMLRKSAIVGAGNEGSSDQSQFNVQPFRIAAIGDDPRRRLSLLDLMPRMAVSSNAFEFNRLDGYTNAADYQIDEGDVKAEGTFPTELQTARIRTIAHWIKASNQVLADEQGLQKFLGDLMAYGALNKLEREIISGTGTNSIAGLRATGNNTVFTPSSNATNAADKIGEALAALDVAGWSANVILLHPLDWQGMRSERAVSGGEYLAGSWNNPAAPNVWSVPVVTSPAVPEGEAFTLDTSQVMLLDRSSPMVEIGYTDQDFISNLVVLRAELRAGLAVLSPSAVMHFDL